MGVWKGSTLYTCTWNIACFFTWTVVGLLPSTLYLLTIDSRSKLEGIRPHFFMSRDTKALVTFVITMVAVWVSNIVYKIGYNIGY